MVSNNQLYTLLSSDGPEYGPVSAETIRAWYREGRINRTVQVSASSEPRWRPLHDVFDLAAWDQPDVLRSFLNTRVTVLVGDITRLPVDVIVNAANSTLLGGGGVDGAIHEAGGPQILEACREIRRTRFPQGLPTGEAVLTTAGNLPARHVIHTCGPIKGVWAERDAEMLALCYRNSIDLAVQHHLKSIAFPAISTGVYGYPREEAALVSSTAIAEGLARNESIEDVYLIFFSHLDADIFLRNHAFVD